MEMLRHPVSAPHNLRVMRMLLHRQGGSDLIIQGLQEGVVDPHLEFDDIGPRLGSSMRQPGRATSSCSRGSSWTLEWNQTCPVSSTNTLRCT